MRRRPRHTKRKLAEYLEIREQTGDDVPGGPRQALECGIEIERTLIRFWKRLAEGE
ncbi:MAG: hypothetical protein ACJ77Z_01025 [Thermoleophilaceae bacterium]